MHDTVKNFHFSIVEYEKPYVCHHESLKQATKFVFQ